MRTARLSAWIPVAACLGTLGACAGDEGGEPGAPLLAGGGAGSPADGSADAFEVQPDAPPGEVSGGDGGAPAEGSPDQGAESSKPDGAAGNDGSPVDAPFEAVADADSGVVVPELPFVHNLSGASAARVEQLVRRAVDGLGFPAGNAQGPNKDDRFFVGRRYMAWIDQTGFWGKMNGLWRLDAAAGDALDFLATDPDGRPVNLFVVGEDGDGRWAPGYRGGEHVEFPSRVPEPNDNPACAQKDWCNQYGMSEAAPITDPDIPWWSACNPGSSSWTAVAQPVVDQPIAGGVKLVYEGPLVKQADGDGKYDGDACHQDYLFEDGVRRRVWLRVGYELMGDEDFFDRTMQLRNPAGNPQLVGAMSLIGGFVMTRWPSPHYLKRLNRFVRPESADVQDTMHSIALHKGQWNAHAFAPTSNDEVFAWLEQSITLAALAAYAGGRSATLSHVGPSDNDDVGFCLCNVHGGLEMGGGLIHAGVSLPIGPGASTIEAKRRLALRNDVSGGTVEAHVYEAETSLSHKVGHAEADGWAATTSGDVANHIAYGPYATDWGGGSAQAVFVLMVDDNSGDDTVVVTLDVHDADTQQVLGTRAVRRRELWQPYRYQRFGLNVDLAGHAGHHMEVRVWWHDISYVRLDKVVVNVAQQG
jgi:hypothetical protein